MAKFSHGILYIHDLEHFNMVGPTVVILGVLSRGN